MAETYRFAVLGPFPVPIKKDRSQRRIDFSRATQDVFALAEDQAKQKLDVTDIRKAVGCYVFALKPSGGKVIWPYYVGQSCQQDLATRLFQLSDKPEKYNAILGEYKRAAAYMYLLPLLTPSGRLARVGTNQNRIDHAEYALIGMALRVNYSLWNIKHRVAIESFSIDGTPQSERRRDTAPASSFRRMLGFADRPRSSGRATGELEPGPQNTEDLPLELPDIEDSGGEFGKMGV